MALENSHLRQALAHARAATRGACPHVTWLLVDSHAGSEVAAEFQKILDRRGVVQNEPIGALAHLDLARTYALQGDATKARAAYQDFLALWKDADPDIPILRDAKAEYAKLK